MFFKLVVYEYPTCFLFGRGGSQWGGGGGGVQMSTLVIRLGAFVLLDNFHRPNVRVGLCPYTG